MEADHAKYHDLVNKSRSADQSGDWQKAIQLSITAWESIDGMIRYASKYEGTPPSSIEAIDIVLKNAPVVLQSGSMQAVDTLLEQNKRIARIAPTLTDKLATARRLMAQAHRAWDCLEQNEVATLQEIRKCLGDDRLDSDSILRIWCAFGLVRHVSGGFALVTRLASIVQAKCSHCGRSARQPKRHFLVPTACAHCRNTTDFVILAEPTESGQRV